MPYSQDLTFVMIKFELLAEALTFCGLIGKKIVMSPSHRASSSLFMCGLCGNLLE